LEDQEITDDIKDLAKLVQRSRFAPRRIHLHQMIYNLS